jgi:hypothetical protein
MIFDGGAWMNNGFLRCRWDKMKKPGKDLVEKP